MLAAASGEGNAARQGSAAPDAICEVPLMNSSKLTPLVLGGGAQAWVLFLGPLVCTVEIS